MVSHFTYLFIYFVVGEDEGGKEGEKGRKEGEGERKKKRGSSLVAFLKKVYLVR